MKSLSLSSLKAQSRNISRSFRFITFRGLCSKQFPVQIETMSRVEIKCKVSLFKISMNDSFLALRRVSTFRNRTLLAVNFYV